LDSELKRFQELEQIGTEGNWNAFTYAVGIWMQNCRCNYISVILKLSPLSFGKLVEKNNTKLYYRWTHHGKT